MTLSLVARGRRYLLGRTDPAILMYHRVAATTVDPWALAVDPINFVAQMKVLSETRRPVALDWLVSELLAGRRPPSAVAITFDDGYLDVLENAKPALDLYGIPATVFIVTGMLGSAYGFWWDRLASAVFNASEMPEAFDAFFKAFTRQSTTPEIGNRADVHRELWRYVRLLPPHERDESVGKIENALGYQPKSDAPVMTKADIGKLIEGGQIVVGSHTVSHPSLPSLSQSDQHSEMLESRRFLESLTGQPIRRFAYPFGDYDARSEALANELGFHYAVSVRAGAANSAREIFRLPRYEIRNWPASEFMERLQWFG